MNAVPDPLRSGPRRSRAGWAIAILIMTVVAGCVVWTHRPAAPPVRFVVAHGESAHEIAVHLQQQGFLWRRTPFLFWVRLLQSHKPIRSGVYELSPNASSWSLFRALQHGPPRIKVTFPEGWTARQMAAELEAKGVTPAADFLPEVERERREGFLFPDTYFFEMGLPASIVIGRMVHRFHEMEPKDMLARAQALHLTYQQVVILASLVEREARVPSERPVIAGVFLNRLKKRWRLESCATVDYALGAWKPQLTYKDLQIDSPYNTYRHGGLPPGPICNPGAPSLVAAAHPAATDMMFFVSDGHGTHRFSKYYKDHLAVQGYTTAEQKSESKKQK